MSKWLHGLIAIVMAVTFALPAQLSADAATAKKYLVYANALYKQRQYDKAIQYYSGALKQDRRLSDAWKGLGNCYYAKRDKANAIKYYKYALQTNPNDQQLAAFVSRLSSGAAARPANPLAQANAYYQQRNYDAAISAYNQVIAANPNDANAYQGLGNAYYQKGDKTNAVASYKRSLQLNPANQGLANYVAKIAPQGQQMAAADGPKEWLQPLWRSALLPGWGQFYNGEPVKGLILGGFTLGFWAAEIGSYMVGSGAAKEYRDLGTEPGSPDPSPAELDAAYGTWDSMANINHIAFIGHTVLYSFTLIDAIWSAKPKRQAQAMYEPPMIIEEPRLKMALGTYGPKLEYDLLRF